MSKVTNRMEAGMRAMAHEGFSTYEIAAHFDVSQTTAATYTRGIRPKVTPKADAARERRMIAAVRAYDEGRAGLDQDAIAHRFGFEGAHSLRKAARVAEQRLTGRLP